MAEANLGCEGIRDATQLIEFMAETAADANGVPMSPEKEEVIRQFMARLGVGFVGEFDPTPRKVAYECMFNCSECTNRVYVSVKGELAAIEVPPECPQHDQMSLIRQEDVPVLLSQESDSKTMPEDPSAN